MNIVVLELERFGQERSYPAIEAAKKLAHCIMKVTIRKIERPSIAYGSFKKIEEAMHQFNLYNLFVIKLPIMKILTQAMGNIIRNVGIPTSITKAKFKQLSMIHDIVTGKAMGLDTEDIQLSEGEFC